MLDQQLETWIHDLTGARVTHAERLFSGGSRQTWRVDADTGTGTSLPLILRIETGQGSHAGTDFSLAREYVVYRALEGSDVPVPRAYGLSEDENALLLERVAGVSNVARLEQNEQRSIARHFMESIAALHRLDIDALPLEGFTRPDSDNGQALLEVDRWETLARERTSYDYPIVRYAFSWLRHNAPANVERTVFIQGDTGPGNFVAQDGRVTGIVDWEFSHLGDFHDDLAWIKMRTDRLDFGHFYDEQWEAYRRDTGFTIDPAHLAYYWVMVMMRLAVTTEMAMFKGGGAMGLAGYMVSHQSSIERVGPALLDAMSLRPEETAIPAFVPASTTGLFDNALAELNERVRPQVKDLTAKVALNGINSMLNHLRLRDALGETVAEADEADQLRVFGKVYGDDEILRLADEAGSSGDEAVLRYLTRRCDREGALWQMPPGRASTRR